ncbi:MAG: DUF4430 domain-containing protein [Candidatus Thermoplasmatota archaeon]
MISKEAKSALVVLLAAVIGIAALLAGLHYMRPQPPAHAAVVDLKIYGPGWTITVHDVGVENATVLSVLNAAETQEDIGIEIWNQNEDWVIRSVNGTSNQSGYFWSYGFVRENSTGALTVDLEPTPLNVKAVQNGDVIVLWYSDDPLNSTPIIEGELVTVTLNIYGADWRITVPSLLIGLDNTTVLDALQIASIRYNFSVETVHYVGFGDFVTGINGTSGNMTHFWLYGVNGVPGDVGASQKEVHTGDVIVWWYTDDFTSQPPGE